MTQPTDFAWDLFYRDDRFIVYRGRFEVLASLGLLVLVAAVVRVVGGHGGQAAGGVFAFLVYAVSLVASLKLRGAWRAAPTPPPFVFFGLAGSAAGLFASFLVTREPLFLVAAVAGGIVFGGAHWFVIRMLWRAAIQLLRRPPGTGAA